MCKLCGYNEYDGCGPVGSLLAHESNLTADDWRKIYEFMRYVWLPFLHSTVLRARARAGIEYTEKGNPKRKRGLNGR